MNQNNNHWEEEVDEDALDTFQSSELNDLPTWRLVLLALYGLILIIITCVSILSVVVGILAYVWIGDDIWFKVTITGIITTYLGLLLIKMFPIKEINNESS